ncbi:xanthine dehydrogenase accessory protein XdhC [Rhodobacteraceae bacterium N5(2021)]|uniref:Xanthine dehydrogenase accessory protein XdhC n=1 Tax=Gymnodinialimonas phycosphaerae TaxID=2841589 RepID=A0A975TU00_9RHOB|nr:xanthine dehydrogenase accessory protein XdhC [Gymnodinialimonas phycosphaerae]MBY4894975.1 xanthine dehydrogenase accessory protein XdhC [Gymnodinialimonas phycosphaerae]
MTPIRVTIAEVKGSAPRNEGTSMLVHGDRIEGTIGGGALEWEAMRLARAMLDGGPTHARHVFPLGPALGQCCGGAVTLEFQPAARCAETEKTALWIWGAGHVGRALVHSLFPLPGFALTWVDTAPDRFPQDIPSTIHKAVAADPPRLMPHAPSNAHHLIATYSHDIDLALCHAALAHDFATAGVIGSATKWARFRKRLRQLGHSDAQISRIMCPIGDPSLGKHPQAIAIGVAARLLGGQMLLESAQTAPGGT